jgi:hypothetical protein
MRRIIYLIILRDTIQTFQVKVYSFAQQKIIKLTLTIDTIQTLIFVTVVAFFFLFDYLKEEDIQTFWNIRENENAYSNHMQNSILNHLPI